jgi:hypothetical protein
LANLCIDNFSESFSILAATFAVHYGIGHEQRHGAIPMRLPPIMVSGGFDAPHLTTSRVVSIAFTLSLPFPRRCFLLE